MLPVQRLPWMWNFRKQLWFREMQRKTQHLRHRTRDVRSQPPNRHLAPSPSATCSGQCPKPSYRAAASGRGSAGRGAGDTASSRLGSFGAGGCGGADWGALRPFVWMSPFATSSRNAMRLRDSRESPRSRLYCSQEFTRARSARCQSTDCGHRAGQEAVSGVRYRFSRSRCSWASF